MDNIECRTEAPLHYSQQADGDHIKGTRRQIQSLGIGLGLAFPGEAGAAKRKIKAFDPRGYRVTIYADGDGWFHAHIHFPNWPARPHRATPMALAVAPGVTRVKWSHCDRYIGTASALVAAGIVRDEQIPGPGRVRTACATWKPDGQLCPIGASCWDQPGAVSIERHSDKRIEVAIRVSREEENARDAAKLAAYEEWDCQVALLPRPAPLKPIPQCHVNRGAARFVESSRLRANNVVQFQSWRRERAPQATA